jgi:hypothetical protein
MKLAAILLILLSSCQRKLSTYPPPTGTLHACSWSVGVGCRPVEGR